MSHIYPSLSTSIFYGFLSFSVTKFLVLKRNNAMHEGGEKSKNDGRARGLGLGRVRDDM